MMQDLVGYHCGSSNVRFVYNSYGPSTFKLSYLEL